MSGRVFVGDEEAWIGEWTLHSLVRMMHPYVEGFQSIHKEGRHGNHSFSEQASGDATRTGGLPNLDMEAANHQFSAFLMMDAERT